LEYKNIANYYENPNLDYLSKIIRTNASHPPNVGWPSGKAWIDSSTLMLRLKRHKSGAE
jgi:hypothetical protein